MKFISETQVSVLYVFKQNIYFQVYNKVLIIYDDARVEDAMQYLERNLKFINEGMYLDATDEKMLTIYQSKNCIIERNSWECNIP